MKSRSEVAQLAGGAVLVLGLHVALGMFVANTLWGGRDAPAEWTFYYASGGCLLLPFTAIGAWLLTRSSNMRHAGQGAFAGLSLATAVIVVALLTGYAPPWISEGWTGHGWS